MEYQASNGSPFFDAVLVQPENNFQIGMVVGKAVLTASETQVYKRVEKLLQENLNLKTVLQQNSAKMKKHYEDCLKWKNGQKDREDNLRIELNNERKEVEILHNKIQSYDAALTETYAAPRNSFYEELNEHYDKLDQLMSLEYIQEETNEHDFAVIRQAVQESKSVINDLKKYDFPDTHVFANLRSRLYDINRCSESVESEKFSYVKLTIGAVQESFRKFSNIPVNGIPAQQITFSQYIDLKAKYDITVTENQQNAMKVEQLEDIETENKDLMAQLKAAHKTIIQLDKDLKEKNEQIRSMEFKKENESFEIPCTNQIPGNKQFEEENRKLKAETERLKEELKETNDTFNKIDDENNDLHEKIELLEQHIQDLKHELATAIPPKCENQEFQQQTPSIPSDIPMESLTVVDHKEVTMGSLGDQITELTLRLEITEAETTDLAKTKDELLHTSQLHKEMYEKEKQSIRAIKQKYDDRIERFKKRENKDNDKINLLKKDTTDMRLHIEQLQELINKKTEKDKEVESLQMQSMLFVNREETCDSFDDPIISLDESTVIQVTSDSADEAASLECDILSSDELTKTIQTLEDEKAALKLQLNDLNDLNKKFEQELKIKEENVQRLLRENNDLEQQVICLDQQINCSRENSMDASDTRIVELQERLSNQRKALEDRNEMLEARLTDHESKTMEIQAVLEIKEQENRNLLDIKEMLENDLQRLLNEFKIQGEQLVTNAHSLEATQRILEKYKQDYEKLYCSYEPLMRMKNEFERSSSKEREHIDKLTAEVYGAKDLIEQKTLENQQLLLKLQEQDAHVRAMKEELETIPILKMQMDVYQNDFNAERESREKLQNELQQIKDHLNQLSIENMNLKEQFRLYGNPPLRNFQNRHATDYQNQFRNSGGSAYDRPHPRYSPTGGGGGGQGGNHPGLYGRGSENRNNVQQDRNDDTEQRNCPKCQKSCPDLDTLQIHLMECLDNEEEGGNK